MLRNSIITLILLLFVAFWTLPANSVNKRLYLNTSASMPRGLYKVVNTKPQKGSIVVIDLSPEVRTEFVTKGYITNNTLLMKKIVAEAGDHVCIKNDMVLVNDMKVGVINNVDSHGAFIEHKSLCRILSEEELYVLGDGKRKNSSLDSRYFGPIINFNIKKVVPSFVYAKALAEPCQLINKTYF